MMEEGWAINSPTPWRPFLAPSPSMSFNTAGSAATRCPCSMESTNPGAVITSKRSSTPTKNLGGIFTAWIAPN